MYKTEVLKKNATTPIFTHMVNISIYIFLNTHSLIKQKLNKSVQTIQTETHQNPQM